MTIILAVGTGYPLLAAEQETNEGPSMEQIIDLCEKEAQNKPNPEDYIDKCIEQKSSDAPESKD